MPVDYITCFDIPPSLLKVDIHCISDMLVSLIILSVIHTVSIWYEADIRLISNCHAPGHFWTNYGMTRERWGIWFMANGEFIHCACLIIRKWWIRSLWNSHASHTTHKETPMYANIFVRIDDVNNCPFLVKPPGHQWFPLTKGQWCGGFYILIVVHVNRLLN